MRQKNLKDTVMLYIRKMVEEEKAFASKHIQKEENWFCEHKKPGGRKSRYLLKKAKRREHNLKSRHKMTPDEYGEILKVQGGVCAICGVDPSTFTSKRKKLFVDHDHTTGENRGLLCGKCNSLLGFAEDNVGVLLAAIRYLQHYSE